MNDVKDEENDIPWGDNETVPAPSALRDLREVLQMLVNQSIAVDQARDHERDLRDWQDNLISAEEYRAQEADRHLIMDSAKVFYNGMLGEYCIETIPFDQLSCGWCGAIGPGDPCRGCGRVQPVCSEDYDRANNNVIELDDKDLSEPSLAC